VSADGTPPATELALLRSELLLPLTELRGDVRLILQRMDQQDARAQEHGHQLALLDSRVDAVERTTVTREEMTAAIERARADAAEQRAEDQKRADRRLTIVSIIVAAVGALLGAGVAIVAIIVQ
jgi:hypothetical protein